MSHVQTADNPIRQVAPGPLELVRAFVNSADLEAGTDEIQDIAGLRRWLIRHRLLRPGEAVLDVDAKRAVGLRELLRSLLVADTRGKSDPAALKELNQQAGSLQLMVRFDSRGRTSLESSASGVPAALSRILGHVHTAMADGSWTRLKVCAKESCRWAFYDHSRNHSGTWCNMAVCGNRVKVSAFRQRHKIRAAERAGRARQIRTS